MLLSAAMLAGCSKSLVENEPLPLDKYTISEASSTTPPPCIEVHIIPPLGPGFTGQLIINGIGYQFPRSFIDLTGLTPDHLGRYKIFSSCGSTTTTPPMPQPGVKLHSDSLVNSLATKLIAVLDAPTRPAVPVFNSVNFWNAIATTTYVGDGAEYVGGIFNTTVAVNPSVPKLPTVKALFTATMVIANPYLKRIKVDYLENWLKDDIVVIALYASGTQIPDPYNPLVTINHSKITFIDNRFFASDVPSEDVFEQFHVSSPQGRITMREFFTINGTDKTNEVQFYMFTNVPRPTAF